MNTYSSFCTAACIFMIFIGIASLVIQSTGAFPGESVPTLNTSTAQGKFAIDYTNIFTSATIYGTFIVVAITAAILSKTTNLAGIWIFGAMFWGGWLSLVPIFNSLHFANNITGGIILTMLTVGMGIMFVSAVIGMLTGNHQMK